MPDMRYVIHDSNHKIFTYYYQESGIRYLASSCPGDKIIYFFPPKSELDL